MCAWLCPVLWDPMDYSPPGFSNHRILQARILKCVAMPFSRGSSRPRDRTRDSCSSRVAGRFFTTESPGQPSNYYIVKSLSHVQLFATPWTVANQAPRPMGFSRHEYWSGHFLLQYQALIISLNSYNNFGSILWFR